MKRPLAYITAAWSENEIENTEIAAKYCRAIYEAGFAPVCPLLHLPLYLNDEIPKEHKDGRCAVVSAPDRNYHGVCGRGAPHGGGSVTLPHGPPA